MCDILVRQIDHVFSEIITSEGIAREISDLLSFEEEGARHTWAFKCGKWDGIKRLFNYRTKVNKLPSGLVPLLCIFAKNREYTIEIQNDDILPAAKPPTDQIRSFIDDHLNIHHQGKKISARDHQIRGIRHAISAKRTTLLSATSSGKSLMIYGLIRHYQYTIPSNAQILLIVPNVDLTKQMFGDFADYSSHDDKWDAEENVHIIHQGQEKETDKQVIVSTWQSLKDMPKEYFDNFEVVFCDEVHRAKGDKIQHIMSSCVNAPYRIGLTGTLQDAELHKLEIEGMFGISYTVITTKEMIALGLAPPINIDCIVLQYPKDVCKAMSGKTYHEEQDWIVSLEKRNMFFCNMANNLNGNSLFLFQYVDKHGIPMYEMFKEHCTKDVYLIHGKVASDVRKQIRDIMENNTDVVVLASFGTTSTGISIKNLHNIVFTSSAGKKKIQTIQSIGRALRQHESKDLARLFDVTDDMTHNGKQNFTLKHFTNRVGFYAKEGHKYSIIPLKL